MTTLLSLSAISKTFDNGLEAIARIDLDVAQGQFLSLVGPSGCGKSTALRIAAGLVAPTRGTVAWPQGRPQVGFVFQDPTLMPWANVAANVRLPLDLMHMKKSEAEDRAARAIKRVG